jgi:D-3-phosphoglycerate dehydrogenase
VNAINALRKAAELGIAISSGHTSSEHGFTRLLKTRVDHAGQNHRVDATLLADEEPRIVRLDGYWLDLDPAGDWLLLENEDVPGVVGNVGTLLGQRGINIGELRLGRAHGADTSRAISVWQVDAPVGDDVVGQLEDVPRIYGVRQLRLGPSRRRNR